VAPVGIGVIGCRSPVATNAVMPAIDASDGACLVAVAAAGGPVPDRWRHLDAGTYDDVVDHPDVDALYVPLPNGMHREWTERAARAGKHVLCEKPIAPIRDDAAAMFGACRGVMLAEAWMTPFDARWKTAIELARRGEIGDVVDIDTAFTFTIGPAAATNYRWCRDQGGGALLDVGIYCLGPIVACWDAEPDRVEATAMWDRRGVDARTEATLEWADGRHARIRCSFVDEEEQRIELIGTEASLVVSGDAHTGGGSTIVRADRGGNRTVEVAPTDPYLGMVEAFAAAVRGETTWPRSPEQTLAMVGLLERIARASR
jgi:predicted dehydrogenase